MKTPGTWWCDHWTTCDFTNHYRWPPLAPGGEPVPVTGIPEATWPCDHTATDRRELQDLRDAHPEVVDDYGTVLARLGQTEEPAT